MRAPLVALALTFCLAACNDASAGEKGAGEKGAGEKGAGENGAAAAAAPASVPQGPLGEVLTGYEQLRRDLADDDGKNVVAVATKIEAAAAALVADKKPGADDIALGAKKLKDLGPEADIKAQRVAFGDLSRGVVAAVAADPALQTGRYLFSCPMAAGYQKWVQLAPKMANPYMGKKMLECGESIATWKVPG